MKLEIGNILPSKAPAPGAGEDALHPFMDFSFFPVEVDATVLAEADQELENFESAVQEELDGIQVEFNCDETDFADTPTLEQSNNNTDDEPLQVLSFQPSMPNKIADATLACEEVEPIPFSKCNNNNSSNNEADDETNWISKLTSDLSSAAYAEDETEFSTTQSDFYADIGLSSGNNTEQSRFKPIHEEKWNTRFNEFLQFVKKTGHGAVPHNYPENPQLARWVKRQRRQYKLMNDRKPSTMTTDRAELLSTVGMIWDTHEVNWCEKIHALEQFHRVYGHTNVPTKFKENNLGTWVKCQRRQYKLYREGKTSAMTPARIAQLEKFNFRWEVHGTSSKSTVVKAPVKPSPCPVKATPCTSDDQLMRLLLESS